MIDAFPWILAGIVGILILVLLVVFLYKRRSGMEQPTDYKTLFLMGLVWLIIGAGFNIMNIIQMAGGNGEAGYDFTFNGLFTIGLIFFLVGIANRDKWKDATPLTTNQKIGLVVLVIATAVLVVVTALIETGAIA